MKNSSTTILVAITLAFAAFVGGFCLGRNTSGQKVEVSAYVTTSSAENSDLAEPSSAATNASLININTASLEDLTSLPGIGPIIAQRIIDHRTEYGDFENTSELLDVEGIGVNKLEKILDYITV